MPNNEHTFLQDKRINDLYGPNGILVRLLNGSYPYSTGAILLFAHRAVNEDEAGFIQMLSLIGQKSIENMYLKRADGENQPPFSYETILLLRFLIDSHLLCFGKNFYLSQQKTNLHPSYRDEIDRAQRHRTIREMIALRTEEAYKRAQPGFFTQLFNKTTISLDDQIAAQIASEDHFLKKRLNQPIPPTEDYHQCVKEAIGEKEYLELHKGHVQQIRSLNKDEKSQVERQIQEIRAEKWQRESFGSLPHSTANTKIRTEMTKFKKQAKNIQDNIKKHDTTLQSYEKDLRAIRNDLFNIHFQMQILKIYFASQSIIHVLRFLSQENFWRENQFFTQFANDFHMFLNQLKKAYSEKEWHSESVAQMMALSKVLSTFSKEESRTFIATTFPLLQEDPSLVSNLCLLFKMNQDYLTILKYNLKINHQSMSPHDKEQKQMGEDLLHLIKLSNQLLRNLMINPQLLQNTDAMKYLSRMHEEKSHTLKKILFGLGIPLVNLLVFDKKELATIHERAAKWSSETVKQKKNDGSAFRALFHALLDEATISRMADDARAQQEEKTPLLPSSSPPRKNNYQFFGSDKENEEKYGGTGKKPLAGTKKTFASNAIKKSVTTPHPLETTLFSSGNEHQRRKTPTFGTMLSNGSLGNGR